MEVQLVDLLFMFLPAATCRYRTHTPYTYHYVKSTTCTDVQNGCCYLATRFDKCFDQMLLGGNNNKITLTNAAAVNCFTKTSGGSNVAWTKLNATATYSTVSTCGAYFPTYAQQLLAATINTGFGTCTANKPDNTNSGGSFGPAGCPAMTDLHFSDSKCRGYTVGCMIGIANLVRHVLHCLPWCHFSASCFARHYRLALLQRLI